MASLTISEVAHRTGVSPSTLRNDEDRDRTGFAGCVRSTCEKMEQYRHCLHNSQPQQDVKVEHR